MFKMLMFIVKWASRILTLLRLKKMGMKWLVGGVVLMFVLPMILRACFGI